MTHAGPLVVIGDALLDRDVNGTASRLCPDAAAPVLDDLTEIRRPGGAALAALLAARDGGRVVLIAPIGDDPASVIVQALLQPHVIVVPLPLDGPLPDKARFRAGGQTLLRADGPAGRPGPASQEAAEAIASAGTLLVSDYGRGAASDPRIRAALAGRAARVPLVWDPHPRGPEPVPGTRLATPNHREALEAAGLDPAPGGPPAGRPGPAGGSALVTGPVLRSAAEAAGRLLSRWPVDGVAVTLGQHGTLLAQGSPAPLVVPARPVQATDTCGAGDMFAAAAAVALSHGALPSEAVVTATRTASDFLAVGGVGSLRFPMAVTGAVPADPGVSADTGAPAGAGAGGGGPAGAVALTDPVALADRVHAAGGTVVAAGGCFDVLHAGHVSLLQAARSLGDCLIVCLNSDESVRRLKGEGRPLNPAADRVSVLAALHCVDAVLVFGEDTPGAALQRLRPDVWVKGGDYEGQVLPEAALLSTWAGQAVTVPYLAGRSTTRLQAAGAAALGAR